MKKVIYLFVGVMAITACTQENVSNTNEDETNLQLKSDTVQFTRGEINDDPELNFREAITCQGNCSGTEIKCQVMVSPINNDWFECSCEGCTLHIIYDKSPMFKSGNHKELTFIHEFREYVKADFIAKGVEMILINEIIIEDYKKARVISYNYIGATGELKSLMLVKNKDATGKMLDPTLIIECSGGCNSQSETCRERYIGSTGNVECTCEGTCKMEITEKQ